MGDGPDVPGDAGRQRALHEPGVDVTLEIPEMKMGINDGQGGHGL
jgi:hypothetical protein